MDNQINRSMLEHFEITTPDPDSEIAKIGNLNAMRSIENGSLHFIGVPRDQEFIDHSLLNPEYIAQFPNGFIVDFIQNGDGEQHTQQIIADAVSADLGFQSGTTGNDEQDRRLTAALLQLVNKPCHIRIGNETQVIVANKDITLSDDIKSESIGQHNFPTVNNHQILHNEAITDNHFKIYQNEKHSQMQTQPNPPLPPLTPIRRLARQRKNSMVNSSNDIQIFQVNEIVEDEVDNRPRPLTKKSLPHKKRISKKLKNIEKVEAPPPTRKTVIYQDVQQNAAPEVLPKFSTQGQSQFTCELCSVICLSQLEFFAHLKGHYEPAPVKVIATTIPVVATVPSLQTSNAPASNDEVAILNQSQITENLEFSNMSAKSHNVANVKLEQIPSDTMGREHVISDTSESTSVVHHDALPIDDAEFSETEDMLEGIRGVVDKVQESVENDTNDGNDWYNSNSLTENIAVKSEENHQSLNNSVDNFSLFFKNNLVGKSENDEMLPVDASASKLPTDTSQLMMQDTYGIPEESRGSITGQNELPTESEFESMLIDDSTAEDKPLKTSPKRSKRSRKPKTKAKVKKEQFSDFNSMDEDEVSSDDDGKYKKQRRKCSQCDKVFNSSNAFKYHELSHTGERPHQCEVCGKSFFAQSALKVHMRLHSGDKPYECEICKRAFRQWGDLKYHTISIHTDERNFQCEFCGKAFARRYSLVIHRRIHTSERNYKCEFCPKSFRASSYLQNHRKVHTGEKPYACQICGKKFRVSGDLKRHTNIHGRERRKRGSAGTTAGISKTDSIKKEDIKEEIAAFMPKQERSGVHIQSVKAEPNLLMDLNLLHDDLHPTTSRALVKIESNTQINQSTNNGTMIYSDGAVEIYKTETVDRH